MILNNNNKVKNHTWPAIYTWREINCIVMMVYRSNNDSMFCFGLVYMWLNDCSKKHFYKFFCQIFYCSLTALFLGKTWKLFELLFVLLFELIFDILFNRIRISKLLVFTVSDGMILFHWEKKISTTVLRVWLIVFD